MTYWRCSSCLNPLGIGEGFEQSGLINEASSVEGLNPLGIGEGFEQVVTHSGIFHADVLIP